MRPSEQFANAPTGKAIVLFSDGTGNSSAKLFKTNVWRMYEAVDLGPAPPHTRLQISYYDDGVGTSSFAPLAILGGAFGVGLKRNVLDIYRYACRNYKEGDEIYIFGFSRGAFTARLVAALIASEGLVQSISEADLRRKTVAAYRSFRRDFLPRRLNWPTRVGRWLRATLVTTVDRWRGDLPYDRKDNLPGSVRFIGVWDTVAAYGGPIAEITRAIDNWFFPLSMPDYHLHERVQCARHALALDDARDAFHPLLWDEAHEQALVEAKKVDRNRMQQVWFTGMHADVGGGYPDESLSYVSLLWMLEEANKAGLRTVDVVTDRIRALASSSGPLHDSRSGLGAYYRYQPRRIAAWLNPVTPDTLNLRDPATDTNGRSRGLLQDVKVHESVVNRIVSGTDRYAPIALPPRFIVYPPQQRGEDLPQPVRDVTGARGAPPPGGSRPPQPMLNPMLVASLDDERAAAARRHAFEPLWNLVWWRRVTYFATLGVTLLLLALPLYVSRLPTPPLLADGRTWIGGVIRLLTIVLPSALGDLVDVYADNPFYFLALSVVIVALLLTSRAMGRQLQDRGRRVWENIVDDTLEKPQQPVPLPPLQRLRQSVGYQRSLHLLKWRILPDFAIAPLIVIAAAWVLFAAYLQAWLPHMEDGDSGGGDVAFCEPSVGAPAITVVSRHVSTKSICSDSFGLVTKGERYTVTFDVDTPWVDSVSPASPQGLTAADLPSGIGYLATPFKRVINANYLQPLIKIGPVGTSSTLLPNVQIYALDVEPVENSRTSFQADFIAPRDGELFIFVNDAVLPFKTPLLRDVDFRYFYRNNEGSARVTIAADSRGQFDAADNAAH